jgi:hypothetical protein
VIGAPLNGTGFGFTATCTVAVAPCGGAAADVGEVGPPELPLHLVAAKAAAITKNGSARRDMSAVDVRGMNAFSRLQQHTSSSHSTCDAMRSIAHIEA